MIAFTVAFIITSTASPVYAAENRVFHMSFYVHNWRGEITSLEFYDGAGATEEQQEAEIIVDEEEPTDEPAWEPTDEIDEPIIVDEEEPADESSDSEQIPSVVIEEITSEAVVVEVEAPEIEAAPEPEIISIITTEENIEETEETITTEVGESQDVETYTLAREE